MNLIERLRNSNDYYAEDAANEIERLQSENIALRRELEYAKIVIQNEYPEDQWADYRIPQINVVLEAKK